MFVLHHSTSPTTSTKTKVKKVKVDTPTFAIEQTSVRNSIKEYLVVTLLLAKGFMRRTRGYCAWVGNWNGINDLQGKVFSSKHFNTTDWWGGEEGEGVDRKNEKIHVSNLTLGNQQGYLEMKWLI